MKTADVSKVLGVQPVTVRKYVRALETEGYIVERSDGKNRDFSKRDVMALQDLATLCEHSGLAIEQGAKVIATRHKVITDSVTTEVVLAESDQVGRYANQYNELVDMVRTMGEHNQHQANELERLHKRMDDQNNNISVMLREVLETRRMVAAAHDKKWWQFWREDAVLLDLNDPETLWKLNGNKPK